MKNYFIFNDRNMSVFDKEIIKAIQVLVNEKIIRLLTTYGAVDLAYDKESFMYCDYNNIKEILNHEQA